MLTIERSLNVYAAGIPQIINLSQYDNDFQLVFSLYTSEGAFTVPSGTTAEIMGTKVDGNGYSADATISGNTVTVTGNNQMTACAGRNVFEIVLTNSGKRLATINFILQVERAALDADTIQSETVLKELNAIIDSAATSTQAAEDAEDAADRAEEAARTLTIDPTLTQSGQAADAKVTGDEITDLKADLSHIGISDSVKVALLDCFAHIAWIDEHGDTYYSALESALYEDGYPRITAVFDSGSAIIYTDDSLDTLKQYLVVKYQATSESQEVVIPSTDYALSGVLSEGSNTVVVTYNTLSTTFIVNAVDFYNIWTRSLSLGNMIKLTGTTDVDTSSTTGIYIGYSDYNNRRKTVVVKKGIAPFVNHLPDHQSQVLTDDYPIPIPSTANKIKVSITPNTQYSYINITKYDSGTGKYVNYDNSVKGWTQGVNEKSFTASDHLFANINFKYDSAGSSYPVEPTAISIEFSEV